MAKKKASKKKPGLYANIHKAQERAKRGGKPVRKKGEAGAPKASDFKKSEKTAKKKTTKKATKKKTTKKAAKKKTTKKTSKKK